MRAPRFLVAALAALVVGAGAAPARAQLSSKSETLTIDSTAAGIGITFSVLQNMQTCTIRNAVAQVRFKVNGEAPTAAIGTLLEAGDVLTLESIEDAIRFRAIRTGGSSGVATVTCSVSRMLIAPAASGGGGGGVVTIDDAGGDDVSDDANNAIRVNVVAGAAGGTQYTEADVDATITGTALMFEGAANTLVAAPGTAADGLLVNLGTNNDVTVTGTVAVSTINGVSQAYNSGVVGATVLRVNEATDSQMSAGVGAVGDAAATAGSTGSLNAKGRLMTSQLDSIKTAVELIDNAISGGGINISQIGGVAPSAEVQDEDNFVVGTTAVVAPGYIADEASTDSVAEGNIGMARMTLDRILWTANGAVAATSQGASTHYVAVAASTNATNVKNAAGNVYGFRFVNTTSTLYYLRMYNLTTAPTCSSATGFVETIALPEADGGGAGIAQWAGVPQAYTTGIGYCITGGASSTDNTNAATGVYGTILYKD